MSKLIFSFLLLLNQNAFASTGVIDVWKNNQAAEHLNQKKPLEAHEEFTQLLAEEPFHPVYQFNMASSFIAIEQVPKAIKMYNEVLKLQPLPEEILYATYYNLGVLNSLEGGEGIDKALENYQKALALNPDSVEIKTNIELLFKGGKGGGKGDKDQNQDKNEDGDEQKEPQEFTNKPQNPQFNDKEMSKGDVKKILEELKKQEQAIRAKHERKGKREAPRDKNW